jgi:heme/copper-type cytochrome/quinol oxidase subunit 2
MIMGYYYGKAEYTGKKIYYVLSLAVPWVLHGMYDLTLKDRISEINDLLLFMPLIIVAIDVVVLIRMVLFLWKQRNNETYTAAITGPGE